MHALYKLNFYYDAKILLVVVSLSVLNALGGGVGCCMYIISHLAHANASRLYLHPSRML